MNKILLIIGFLSLVQPDTSNDTGISQDTTYVWICTGPSAYAYHSNQNCSGLNRCSAEIKMVTLHDAIVKWKRDKCKKCYKVYYM